MDIFSYFSKKINALHHGKRAVIAYANSKGSDEIVLPCASITHAVSSHKTSAKELHVDMWPC